MRRLQLQLQRLQGRGCSAKQQRRLSLILCAGDSEVVGGGPLAAALAYLRQKHLRLRMSGTRSRRICV